MTQPSVSSATAMPQHAGAFFDQHSSHYDQSILRACPPYQDMLNALLASIDSSLSQQNILPTAALNILELGCGTGNLSVLLAKRFANSRLTLVDLSAEMMQQAETKIRPLGTQYTLLQENFTALQFQPQQFDLVVSSMALHHLLDDEKAALYQHIATWLKPGGAFWCADECLSQPLSLQEQQMLQWQSWAKSLGATDADLQLWLDHAEAYDHYTPLYEHFSWLQAAGLSQPDCSWRVLMWTVFGAQKPL